MSTEPLSYHIMSASSTLDLAKTTPRIVEFLYDRLSPQCKLEFGIRFPDTIPGKKDHGRSICTLDRIVRLIRTSVEGIVGVGLSGSGPDRDWGLDTR